MRRSAHPLKDCAHFENSERLTDSFGEISQLPDDWSGPIGFDREETSTVRRKERRGAFFARGNLSDL
jgi:hypothetical protein